MLPGASHLNIQLWDHEDYLKDQFIGETNIDLEDRFFSRKWRSLKDYPIETRKLHHPSSGLPQGLLRMWLEVIPKNTPNFNQPKRDISLKTPQVFIKPYIKKLKNFLYRILKYVL